MLVMHLSPLPRVCPFTPLALLCDVQDLFASAYEGSCEGDKSSAIGRGEVGVHPQLLKAGHRISSFFPDVRSITAADRECFAEIRSRSQNPMQCLNPYHVGQPWRDVDLGASTFIKHGGEPWRNAHSKLSRFPDAYSAPDSLTYLASHSHVQLWDGYLAHAFNETQKIIGNVYQPAKSCLRRYPAASIWNSGTPSVDAIVKRDTQSSSARSAQSSEVSTGVVGSHGTAAIVVAHCTKELDWLSDTVARLEALGHHVMRVDIFSKCGVWPVVAETMGVNVTVVQPPNVGRNDQTFAHYLATHYDLCVKGIKTPSEPAYRL